MLKRRPLLLTFAAAAAAAAAGAAYGRQTRNGDLTLRNAQQSADERFVQAYLDKLARAGMPFDAVVYDRDGAKAVAFWREELQRAGPDYRAIAEGGLAEAITAERQLRAYRKAARERKTPQPYQVAFPARTSDGKTALFVYEIPASYGTDDDMRWFMKYTHCLVSTFRFSPQLAPAEDTPENQRRLAATIRALNALPEYRSAQCLSDLLKREQDIATGMSASNYNTMVDAYRRAYGLLRQAAAQADDFGGAVLRTAVAEMVNPVQLLPRPR